MGNYAYLTVGRMSLSFKYEAPAFLALAFQEAEYFRPPKPRPRRSPDEPVVCGYRSTASIARATMDANGLSLAFFAEVLDTFRAELEEVCHEVVTDELAERHDYRRSAERLEREYATTFRPRLRATSSQQAVVEYIEFLRNPPAELAKSAEEGSWRIDFEAIQAHFCRRHHTVAPGLALMLFLLDESFFGDYPDVAMLMFLRLSLESVPDGVSITLDLTEVVEGEDDAIAFHAESSRELVRRIQAYNQTFRVLLSRQEALRTQVMRQRCLELLDRAGSSKSAVVKGRALEDLLEAVFGLTDELPLQGRRISTKDEEIDLVFRNCLKSPFWVAFGSPLVLVECKNWDKRVDAKAIRDFETKVRNRGSACRLAYCVAMSGFTRGAVAALSRAGREPYHIVLVSGASIRAFLESSESFGDWLESLTGQVR